MRHYSPGQPFREKRSLMTDTAPAPIAAKKEGGRPRRKPQAPQGRAQNPQEAKAAQPRQRKVNPVLERLFELYPKMFGARFLPLKLGVFQDLLALHPDEFKREDLKVALGLHARSTRYLEAVAAREKRHDLNGVPVEDVAPEHVHHAILEVFRRRQARKGEDLRPQLRARLVEAIEASGLSREEYMLVVRTNDEASNAVLDEAFAELGARTAKREALLRAFEASGRSVAEFAEMYGMDAAEVERTLERARTT
ncbi:prop effector [Variovorax paradoxus]|nr:prop effector [Variovorax paradoxus]